MYVCTYVFMYFIFLFHAVENTTDTIDEIDDIGTPVVPDITNGWELL